MRLVLALAALALAVPATAQAQYYFNGYFGQNKVQYAKFDFQIIQTEHFDIYFYPSERQASLDVARMAERAYAQLSRILNHQFTERKPIILYASHTDFGQTNTTEVGEGTGGVTDFLRQRNVLFLQGALKETEHVLTHEMVHQFQFDICSRGKAGATCRSSHRWRRRCGSWRAWRSTSRSGRRRRKPRCGSATRSSRATCPASRS